MRADESTIADAARETWLTYEDWAISEWGLEMPNQACDIARYLKESIAYRAGAGPFHLRLLTERLQYARDRQKEERDTFLSRMGLSDATVEAQYLFDDLVLNVISLFDYVGCLAGLLVDGVTSYRITWSKAVGKVRQAPRLTRSARVFAETHRTFVKNLLRYRSEIAHFGGDTTDAFVRYHLLRPDDVELHVSVPQWFAKSVLGHQNDQLARGKAESISAAVNRLIEHAHSHSVRALKAMSEDVRSWPNVSRATTSAMLTRRWSRGGVWKTVAVDERLGRLGVRHVGAIYAGSQLKPLIDLTDGTAVEGAWIDLRPYISEDPPLDEVVAAITANVLQAMQ